MRFAPRDWLRQAWSQRFAYTVCVLGVVAATFITDELTPRFQKLEASCKQCHAKYRN